MEPMPSARGKCYLHRRQSASGSVCEAMGFRVEPRGKQPEISRVVGSGSIRTASAVCYDARQATASPRPLANSLPYSLSFL